MKKVIPDDNSTEKKFNDIRELLFRDASDIIRLATKHHEVYLGGKFVNGEASEKYTQSHISIVKEIADNLIHPDIKKSTETFKALGEKLARESLQDKLNLEEAVDGTIFLKQAIWQKLRDEGILDKLSTEDFYRLSYTIGTYCDVLVSKTSFVYHRDYVEKLTSESRHKDEFISMATHELRTPVTSIKAFEQTLQAELAKAGSGVLPPQLIKMEIQIQKLTTLIDDLLDATNITAGKLRFREEIFDFNTLVDEAVEEMQVTTKKHTIIKKMAPSITVRGDRKRIGQAMVNLVSNAIKYSPRSDRIIINTGVSGGSATFCVQDFGIGIAKKDHRRIFRKFQRVGNQDTFGGLGLGLYVASVMIKRHGGRMWVESELGKGATFCFVLPAQGIKK